MSGKWMIYIVPSWALPENLPFFFFYFDWWFIHSRESKRKRDRYSLLYFQSRTLLSFKLEALYSHTFQYLGEKCLGQILVPGADAQELIEGVAGVASDGKGQGLLRARHSPPQPQGATTGHSWALQSHSWHFLEGVFKNGHKTPEIERWREQKKCVRKVNQMRGKCWHNKPTKLI